MIDAIKAKMFNKDTFQIISFMAIFIVIIIIFSQLHGSFLSSRNISNIFKHLSILAISALGLTYVVAVGFFDISFYYNACFASMTMSYCISLNLHPILAIFIGLCGGAVFGAFAGIAVGRYKLPDIITTIGIGYIAFGAAYIFSGGRLIYKNFMGSGIGLLNEARLLNIPLPVIIMFGLYIISYLYLDRSAHGRYFYATGENKVAAFFSGIKSNRLIIIAFIICSITASIAAMIGTAAKGDGYVKIAAQYLMPSFAAVYIGSSIFKKPCVIGTFLGALLMSIITNGFNLIGVPFYYEYLTNAIVLIIAILISNYEFSSKINSIRKKKINGVLAS